MGVSAGKGRQREREPDPAELDEAEYSAQFAQRQAQHFEDLLRLELTRVTGAIRRLADEAEYAAEHWPLEELPEQVQARVLTGFANLQLHQLTSRLRQWQQARRHAEEAATRLASLRGVPDRTRPGQEERAGMA